MNPYPVPFDPTAFPRIPDPVIPREKVSSSLIARAPVMAQSVLRQPATPEAVVTALWIQGVVKTGKRSDSFQNKEPAKNGPADGGTHFHFLPGVDAVEMRWTVAHPEKATKARFEIWSATDDTKVIWF